MTFQGFSKTNGGELRVIPIAVGTALPAGTQMFNGLARSPDGYLYVVISA
jgi:hypothetical protein